MSENRKPLMPKRELKRERDNGFEEWGGYMEAKKSKLADQFAKDAENGQIPKLSSIFDGISIFVNGYTVPTADELRVIMMEHGGMYHHYYRTEKTTYVIASNLPSVKIKNLKGSMKVIKPEWVVDSISAGKPLDYRNYLLYTNATSDQPKISFQRESDFSSDNDRDERWISQEKFTEDEENGVNKMDYIDDGETGIRNNSTNNNSREKSIYFGGQLSREDEKNNELSHFQSGPVEKRIKTASDEKFLSEYYNNSRLHHISTMGASFKNYVNELRSKGVTSFEGRRNLKEWVAHQKLSLDDAYHSDVVIMHIDMDCFFASVGVRKRPDLKGQPVAVTHATGNRVAKREGVNRQTEFSLINQTRRDKTKQPNDDKNVSVEPDMNWFEGLGETGSMAEIASCSYEARKFGVRNGMLLGKAMKKCPNLKTIPYDFEGYKEVSYALYNHIATYTLDIEAVSCDELLVDCTEILKDANTTPLQFATFLRDEIKSITGCPCSTGFGPNQLIARLATKRAKPDGQYFAPRKDVRGFIRQFDVSSLPGVGYALASRLSALGIKTCEDLQNTPLTKLQTECGKKTGTMLHKFSLGEDDRPMTFSHKRKSVSTEINYGIRLKSEEELKKFLKQICGEVEKRLNEISMRGKTITLKLMIRSKDAPEESAKFLGHGVCDHFTKSTSIATATSDSDIIYKEIYKIFQAEKFDSKELRGIGVQVTKLEDKDTKSCVTRMDKFLHAKKSPNKVGIADESIEKPKEIIDSVVPSAGAYGCDNLIPKKITLSNLKISKKSLKSKNRKLDPKRDFQVVAGPIDSFMKKVKSEKSNETFKNKNDASKTECYSKIENVYSVVSASQVDRSFLEALPPDIREEIEANLENGQSEMNETLTPVEENHINLYSRLTVNQLRELLASWILNENEPNQCDVDMLSEYLQNLIFDRDLHNVQVVLRCLNRCVAKTKSSKWLNVYTDITDRVQNITQIAYGSRLVIEKCFKSEEEP